MIATNPHHVLHTILTDDQCTYWRSTPPTILSSLLHDLAPSTYMHVHYQPWKPSNLTFSPPNPPPHTTVLYYVPSTIDNSHVIHLTSRTHTVFTLLQSFIGVDHTQALRLAILSGIHDFPSFSHHFIQSPSFEHKLTSPKPHRDSITFLRICDIIDSSPHTPYYLHHYYTKSKDSPSSTQRRLWNQRFSATTLQPTPPTPLSPCELMWHRIKEEFTPIDHPSALACQTPDHGKPVAAIRGALKSHSRIITSTIIRISTGHCFDANYSQRFRPRSDDVLTCPHTHTHPHLHTRHHIIFQCSQYTKERRKHIPRLWRLPVILQSEDASEKLGLFLKESNCSLLRPIPLPTAHTVSHPHDTPLNPEPP